MIEVRPASVEDIPAIEKIARQYRDELGFVRRVGLLEAITRDGLKVATYDDMVIGFAHGHKRRDGITTIREIAVHRDYKHLGAGRAMIDSFDGVLRLKCTTDNQANDFYQRIGFTCIDTENGRKRELNVWQRIPKYWGVDYS